MSAGHLTDARIAVALSHLPWFQRWERRSLSPQHRRMLREMDAQSLMSLAVVALQQLDRRDQPTTASEM